MKDVKNLDSIPDPRKKIADKEVVNPEKFQKALKLEKSEETDKREKRNRPKKQEEEEDSVDESTASIPVPQGLFKEYMSEEEKTSSIYDAEGGTKAHLVCDGDTTNPSSPMYISDNKDDLESNISVEATDEPSDISSLDDDEDSYISLGDETTPSSVAEDNQTMENSPSFDESNQPINSSFRSDEEDQNVNIPFSSEDDQTSVLKSSSQIAPSNNTDQEKQLNSPTSKQKHHKKTSKHSDVKKAKDKDSSKQLTSNRTSKQSVSEKTNTLKGDETVNSKELIGEKAQLEKRSKKDILKNKDIPNTEKKDKLINQTEAISSLEKDEKHDSKKEGEEDQEIAPVSMPLASPTGVSTIQLSPFSNMPNDVFELFEKMVGLMTVEKDSGKSTTTVTLNMPSSIFNKCELVLEHYDTAPHAYNVQFLGNPEAVDRFTKNMQGLNNAITESKLSFSIHLLPPKLSKAFTGRVERKETDKDKEEGSSSSGGGKQNKDK